METRTLNIHTRNNHKKNCWTRCSQRLFPPQKISHIFWEDKIPYKNISSLHYNSLGYMIIQYNNNIESFNWIKHEKMYVENEDSYIIGIHQNEIFYTLEHPTNAKAIEVFDIQNEMRRTISLKNTAQLAGKKFISILPNGQLIYLSYHYVTKEVSLFIHNISGGSSILNKLFSPINLLPYNYHVNYQYYVLSDNHLIITGFSHDITIKNNDIYLVYLEDGTIIHYKVPLPYDDPNDPHDIVNMIYRKPFFLKLSNHRFALLITAKLLIFEYDALFENKPIRLIYQVEMGKERSIKDAIISLDEKYLITLEECEDTFRNIVTCNHHNKLKRWNITTGKMVDEYTPPVCPGESAQKLTLLDNGNIAYQGFHAFGIIEYHESRQTRKEKVEEMTGIIPPLTDIIEDYELGVSLTSDSIYKSLKRS